MTSKKVFHLFIGLWLICYFTFANAAVILQYHHVSETLPRVTSLSENEFSAHLSYLKDNNYSVVPLQHIIEAVKEQKSIPDKTVALTFDDGFINNFTQAAPILKRFNYPYTIFVNPQLIDEGKSYVMTWPQLKALTKEGAYIANHSAKHDYLHIREDNESLAQWRERIRKDITHSEQRIKQEIGHNFKYVAYPYGEFNRELQTLVKELGYVGIGQHSGAVGLSTDLTRVPRFPASGIYANLDTLKTKIASLPFSFNLKAQSVTTNTTPVLELTFTEKDFNNSQFNCFISGNTAKITWQSENEVTVQSEGELNKGRSRYNCTAPSKSKAGRFYWLSHPFVITK